jgi:phosphatidate cytidylyltransferase
MTVDAPSIPDPAEVPDVGGETAVPPRAGRNLPAAIGVGVTLAAVVLVPLFTARWIFGTVVIGIAMVIGIAEVCRALREGGFFPPMVPLLLGAPLMIVAAYLREERGGGYEGGAEALLLAGFAAMLTAPEDGAQRVVLFVAVTVASDIGGYASGVLAGKHPMAPSVSPKKSWEGFAGSVGACVLAGVVLLVWLLDGEIWQGAVYGLALAVFATLGDLGESLVKRDLGIKDMGHLLPGHGGLMDRLDSLLFTAPVAWVLLTAFIPIP